MPSSFITPLRLEYIDGDEWKITEEFTYLVDFEDPKSAICVPAGSFTDFASIPRFLWTFRHPTDKQVGKAGVVHDYLYRHGGRVYNGEMLPVKTYTREESDEIFREGMKVLGAGWFTRNVMYRAVRMFGGGSFVND